MPDEINKKYQALHLAKIKAEQEKIQTAYEAVITHVYAKAVGLKIKGIIFRISDFPELSKEISKALLSFHGNVEVTLQNGIKDEWELSTEKNANLVHKKYGQKNVSETVNKMLYDPHTEALDQFIKRQTAGLNLSDRVWKYTNQFQSEIEQNLYAGLSEGKSAIQMARDQKQYLQNPDKLFRRIRDAKGKLQLSKAAKAFKPGQGVYRSSFKNAMRLTRTVINDSYREADMIRYESLPFVIGFKVSLSNRHPQKDICDSLAGIYPKTFKWRSWHPQCLCNCVAELPSPEDYNKYEQAILNGTEKGYKFKGQVKQVPDNFNSYVKDNKGKMDNWKKKPDWVTENNIKI